MSQANREWLFRELRYSLSLLAADGAIALRGVPDGSAKADELALDFDQFFKAVVGNFAAELPTELLTSLAAVDAAFDSIHSDGWTEEAVRSAPEWSTIRKRAGVALTLLDRFEA